MKQKLFVIFLLAILVFSLSGCKKPSFSVTVHDDQNVEINAENASTDMLAAAGSLEVAEGQKLYVEPALTKGEINVKITDFDLEADASIEEVKEALNGTAVLDIKISGKDAAEYEIAPGSYGISASVLSKADGTVKISVR